MVASGTSGCIFLMLAQLEAEVNFEENFLLI